MARSGFVAPYGTRTNVGGSDCEPILCEKALAVGMTGQRDEWPQKRTKGHKEKREGKAGHDGKIYASALAYPSSSAFV